MESRGSIGRVGIAALVALLWMATPAQAQMDGLGGFGDSLTDEYAEETYSYATSWYEQVHTYRGGLGGPYGTGWGEPRRDGYQNNWSRSGADVKAVLSSIQDNLGPLSALVGAGEMSHAVVFAGVNDYAFWTSTYEGIYQNTLTPAEVSDLRGALVSRLQQIVGGLQSVGLSVVLASIPDFNPAPGNWYHPDLDGRLRVEAELSNVNDDLAALAQSEGIPFVDLYHFGQAVFGTQNAPNSTLSIGGQTIDLAGQAVPATNAFVDDGRHYHSVIQGMLGHLFLDALDRGYSTGTTPFTEQEIVEHAGLTHLGSTLNIDLSQFVTIHSAIPEPGSASFMISMLLAGNVLRRRRR